MQSEPIELAAKSESSPVLWVGPHDGPEFGDIFEQLAEVRCVESLDGLSALPGGIGDEAAFDFAVLACPRPLVSVAAARPLIDLVGTDSIVQLLGTWCEGEGRTGVTLDGVQRVFWHEWPAWWRQRNAAVTRQAMSSSRDAIWIRTADAEFARALAQTLDTAGFCGLWAPELSDQATEVEITRPAAVLWDGSQLSGDEATRLATICADARETKTPVVALLDFPRVETIAACRALGVSAVLGKPFSIESLVSTISATITATNGDKTPTAFAEGALRRLLLPASNSPAAPLPEAA